MPTISGTIRRLSAVITRFGGTYGYKRGVSSVNVTAKVRIMTSTESFQWFTAAEVTGWAKPAYVVIIAGDFLPFSSSPAIGDTVTINGTVYTVKKFDKARLGGIAVRTLLYCAA